MLRAFWHGYFSGAEEQQYVHVALRWAVGRALRFVRPCLCMSLPKQHLHGAVFPRALKSFVLCKNMPAYQFQRGSIQPQTLSPKWYILTKASRIQGKINDAFLLM